MIWWPQFDNFYFNVVFIAFCGMAALQLLYVLLIQARLSFHKTNNQTDTKSLPPVSVIIAARNESDN
jgi:hypothetical protein